MHPDDWPQLKSRFDEALQRRMPFSAEFRIIRPGGDIRWLANVAQLECDASGKPLCVVGTVQDITTGSDRSGL